MPARRARRALLRVSALVALMAAALLPSGHAAVASGPFTSPVVVTSDNTGEPGIDVAPNNAIFVNAPSSLLNGASWVYRSRDDGATWVKTPNGARNNYPGGGDSDIAVDPVTGRLYMTDLYLGSSTVSFSKDDGNKWKANPLQGDVIQDRQWIASSGNGIAYHITHQIPAGVVLSKSVDGGLTYNDIQLPASVADSICVCPPGTLIVNPATKGLLGKNDHVGVAYNTGFGTVDFARSVKGGLVFSISSIDNGGHGGLVNTVFPVVANDGDHVVAVWFTELGGTGRIWFNSSNDFGATWSTPTALVTTGSAVYPWIAVHGSKIAVSLYHSATAGIPDAIAGSAAWYETYLESTNGGATWSALTTVDPVAVKTGPICLAGFNCNSDRELLDYQSLTLDRLNRANLIWTHSIDNVANTELRFSRQT